MKWVQGISIIGLIVAMVYLGYVPAQSEFSKIFLSAFGAFACYFILQKSDFPTIKMIFLVGLFIRLCLIFSFPNLSDDIYRFIWDGELTRNGMNPYGYLPSELVNSKLDWLTMDLFELMNSPDYYTIYPPFTQLIFFVSTLFGDNVFISTVVMKVIFVIAEVFTFKGILHLLKALNQKSEYVLFYFLNPLVMVEGVGNLHFEIIMITFLVWSLYYIFIKPKLVLGALLYTLSIATKLLPLMFLPFFLYSFKSKDRLRFFLFGIGFTILAFTPIIFGLDFKNFGSSVDLYFQKFEFNASVYYVLRYVGKLISGYNLIFYIGPILGFASFLLIVRKAYNQQLYTLRTFLEFAFYSFVVYLFLATTVHPWYLCIPIFLSVFVKWRFVLIWSFLIMLTYINYHYELYAENLGIVQLEYFIVFGFLLHELGYFKGKRVIDQADNQVR